MDRKLRRKEFYSICRQQIIPMLEKFEPYRKEQMKKLLISNTLSVLFVFPFFLSIISSLCAWWNIADVLRSNIFLVFIGVLISVYFINRSLKINKEFLNYMKRNVASKVWTVFPDLQYIAPQILRFDTFDLKTQIQVEDVVKSSIFNYFEYKKEDDSFICSYKNVKAKMEEAELCIYNPKGKDATVFKGVIMHFPLKKNVKGKTVVFKKVKNPFSQIEKSFLLFLIISVLSILFISTSLFSILRLRIPPFPSISYILYLFPILIVLLSSLERHIVSRKKDLSKVKLEDVEFTRDFNVFSDNQLESRFLLTPVFMEILKRMQTAFGNQNLRCSFFYNSLMIAIEKYEDLFEVGNIFVPLNKYESLIKFYNQLYSVYEMIDYLHIDE